MKWLVWLAFGFLSAAPGFARVMQHIDPENGLKSWRLDKDGFELELIQRLPDQTRGFFLARGFPPEVADQIGKGCVFQTIVRNTADAANPVTLDLTQWRLHQGGPAMPIKLKEDWLKAWLQGAVPDAARTAFRWALFPTEQTFAPGDYAWGMTSFGLPPGSRFDLTLVWVAAGQTRSVVMQNMQCPEDI